MKDDKRLYKRRNRIEIMVRRLKDWRSVVTGYDRCPKVFLSAIALAALVIYWLCVLSLGTIPHLQTCLRTLRPVQAMKRTNLNLFSAVKLKVFQCRGLLVG